MEARSLARHWSQGIATVDQIDKYDQTEKIEKANISVRIDKIEKVHES